MQYHIHNSYLHSHQHIPPAASELSVWHPQAVCRCSEAEGKYMLQEPAKHGDAY